MARIGFIGLGNMGGPMARNLLKAGHELTVFDLSKQACEAAAADGAAVAASAADAARGVAAVITMLPAGSHVRSVYLGDDGLLAAADKGTLFIDSSTIDVDSARAVIEAAGGILTDWKGGAAHDGGRVIASATPQLHAAALELLESAA